jgi:L-lysine 6-oxidase
MVTVSTTGPRLSIHPAIGIARVGNSPGSFYIGPEAAGALPTELDGSPVSRFKDAHGALRRQAARFHIYADSVEVVVGSIVGGKTVTDIVWTAHIANKKSSFYDFLQLQGEHGYTTAVVDGKTIPYPLRNPEVKDPKTRLDTLVIDAGPREISKAHPRAAFEQASAGSYPAKFPPKLSPASIYTLGEMQLDSSGRLLLVGGFGNAGTTGGSPTLSHYANNPGWFDDVSDGPVSALVCFSDGTKLEAEGAWVLCTPPAYAPQVRNSISLYDVMFDLFVRTVPGFRPDMFADGQFNPNYAPSYPDEIFPLLQSADTLQWVATLEQPGAQGERVNTYTSRVQAPAHEFGKLSAKDTLNAQFMLAAMRSDANDPFLRQSNSPAMPFVAGDNPIDNTIVSKFVLFTETQRFLIEQWARGKATDTPRPPLPPGEALDRGVLENCAGGAFCPGIEGGWIFRNPALFSAPFRIKRKPTRGGLTFNPTVGPSEPGDLTQRMAQPWQADFNECDIQVISVADPNVNVDSNRTAPEPTFHTLWWPAQRPMSIYSQPNKQGLANWARNELGRQLSNLDMAEQWAKLGFVINQGSQSAPDFVEVERSYPTTATK